jgi:hypothetical protein
MIHHYDKPVNPTDFYGRREEMQHIFDRLRNRALGSSSIVGLEKSGKTSLLLCLSDLAVVKEHGFAGEYMFMYFNFEGVGLTPIKFCLRVLKRLQPEISDSRLSQMVRDMIRDIQTKDEIDPLALVRLFETIGNKLKIVLVFDGFDNVIKDESFGAEFYSILRRLATNCNLAFIVATRRELSYYCHSKEIESSPFFNIFATIYLGPLSREESATLLKGGFESLRLSLSEEEIEYVIEMTGGHPYLLQAACFYLSDAKRKHISGEQKQLEYTRQRLTKEVMSFFHRCWDSCSEEERRVLLTLARGHTQGRETLSAAELNSSVEELCCLKNKGMIVESDQGYKPFSPIFAEWITEQFPITEEDLTLRNPKIKKLARLMFFKRQHTESPYVLTLGTTALFVRIVSAVISDSEPGLDLSSLSKDERYNLLKGYLGKEKPPEGYLHLAELVKEAYFNLIFSTNFDSFLEDALASVGLRSELNILINRSRHDKDQIKEALSHTSPRVKVVKIRGNFQDRVFALTSREVLEFCEEIKDILIRHLSEDVIIVAHNPDDDDINRCLPGKGGAIWYISPIEPPKSSFAGRVLRANRCRFICGRDGQFDNFFKALCRELVTSTSPSS